MINFRPVIISVVLTIFACGIWLFFHEKDQMLTALKTIGYGGFLYICFFSLINYLLRFFRWRYMLGVFGDRMDFYKGLLCYLSGFALTTTPGKAGEVLRSLYFKRIFNINNSHTLASWLSERTCDALASFLLATMVFIHFDNYAYLGYIFAGMIFIILAAFSFPEQLKKILAWFKFIKFEAFQKLLTHIPTFIDRSTALLSPKLLGIGTFFGFVSWSAEAYAFAWLAQQVGGEASLLLYMSIFAIGMIAGAVSFLPGGIGGAEIVLYLLLTATGLGNAEAITVTLICRLATLWLAVLIGLLAILWLEKNPELARAGEDVRE
jgi:uncharacterized protein (TIRG00374 family)